MRCVVRKRFKFSVRSFIPKNSTKPVYGVYRDDHPIIWADSYGEAQHWKRIVKKRIYRKISLYKPNTAML